MHGLAGDLVYAVGRDGGVAGFDGARWTRVPTPTREVLTGVFVVSADRVYATGAEGSLIEGTGAAWAIAASTPNLPLHDVAMFEDELWIAGGSQGLLRRVGTTSELEKAKPELDGVSIDARARLLIACRDRIVQKGTELLKFTAKPVEMLRKARDGAPVGDFSAL